ETFREAGLPYLPGAAGQFGVGSLLLSQLARPAEALWVAEEAAGTCALAAVVLELRGNPRRLDFTATRRLHHRAQAGGQTLFLLRHGAAPEPTSAPVRLMVAPAPAALRATLAGPLAGSIGGPAFHVSLAKSRIARQGEFVLEWNRDAFSFHERPVSVHEGSAQDAGRVAA